jgi:hypothetical protein
MIKTQTRKYSEESSIGTIMVFDTLRYANRLKAVGVSEEQAEVQAEALAEIVNENIATKKDLKESDTNTHHYMKEMETSLRSDMKEMEAGIRHDMKEMETRLRHDTEELRCDMEKMGNELRYDIKELESRMMIKLGSLMLSGMGLLVLLMKLLKL